MDEEFFSSLYGKRADFDRIRERYTSLIDKHKLLFNRNATLLFSSSGRAEIIGNHTDHNNGLVIASSINLDTIACVSIRDDDKIVFFSPVSHTVTINLNETAKRENEEGKTASLIRGILFFMKEKGASLKGLNINIDSTVPIGSGLSSSASLENLITGILNSLFFDNRLSLKEIARIGERSESIYFNKASGLLDQSASAEKGMSFMDFENPEDVKIETISTSIEDLGLSMIVTNVGECHSDMSDLYSQIPDEMRKVASEFGKNNLREVKEEDFVKNIPSLRKKLNNDRAILRAMHYFEENKRVIKAKKALSERNITEFITLINESGLSSELLLDNLQIPGEHNKEGLKLALNLSRDFLKGQGGVRVHGGGFGGSIIAFVPSKLVEKYQLFMESIYGRENIFHLSDRKLPLTQVEILSVIDEKQ